MKVTGTLAKGVGTGQLGPRRPASRSFPTAPRHVMDTTSPGPRPIRVLFVCLGNICRSPLAEGVFRDRVGEAGLDGRFEIDSAGTGSWHVGDTPDPRAVSVAREHGVVLDSRARQVTPSDLEHFDHVVAMDRNNLRDLERMADASTATARMSLLRDFDPHPESPDVPDPYYGGAEGFEEVYRIVSRSCDALLAHLGAT